MADNKNKHNMKDVTEKNVAEYFKRLDGMNPGSVGIVREEPRDKIEILGYERETSVITMTLHGPVGKEIRQVLFWAHLVYPMSEYPVVEPCFLIRGVDHIVRSSELKLYKYSIVEGV